MLSKIGDVADEHVSLAVESIIAIRGFERHGDQDVNVVGCGDASLLSTILLSSVLSASYCLEFIRDTSESNSSVMMQTSSSEGGAGKALKLRSR
jgi:hypothetical protein